MIKITYHLGDNNGISTVWDVPFRMDVGTIFEHEYGRYRVDSYYNEQAFCNKIEEYPQPIKINEEQLEAIQLPRIKN